MSTSLLVAGAMHQRHIHAFRDDATSSLRLLVKQQQLVDDKDSTMSFANSRSAPVLTSKSLALLRVLERRLIRLI